MRPLASRAVAEPPSCPRPAQAGCKRLTPTQQPRTLVVDAPGPHTAGSHRGHVGACYQVWRAGSLPPGLLT